MSATQTDLDFAVHAQQDVVTLDVAMNHRVQMQKLQSLKNLEEECHTGPETSMMHDSRKPGTTVHQSRVTEFYSDANAPTSREMAAIWPSFSTVSVTTSVSEPPAR